MFSLSHSGTSNEWMFFHRSQVSDGERWYNGTHGGIFLHLERLCLDSASSGSSHVEGLVPVDGPSQRSGWIGRALT